VMNKLEEALRDYEAAIEIRERLKKERKLHDENDLASAYMNRGVTYRVMNKLEEALRDYEAAIEIRERLKKERKLHDENDLAKVYVNRGAAYYHMNKLEEAIRDYETAIEIKKRLKREKKLSNMNKLSNLYNSKACLYRTLKQYDKAISDCNKAIEIDGTFSYTYGTLAEIYSDLKQPDMFYKYIETAFELGCPVWKFIDKDNAYKPYINEERFIRLIEKYRNKK